MAVMVAIAIIISTTKLYRLSANSRPKFVSPIGSVLFKFSRRKVRSYSTKNIIIFVTITLTNGTRLSKNTKVRLEWNGSNVARYSWEGILYNFGIDPDNELLISGTLRWESPAPFHGSFFGEKAVIHLYIDDILISESRPIVCKLFGR